MPDPGLFGPDSVTWRIHREGALLLGGGRAVITQVAHPLVAAGVGEHSRYREDPWGRLYRTIDLYTSVIFGSHAEVNRASRRLWALHGRVHGVTRYPGGRFAAGTPYAARDPDLLLWVHATMVDTALLVYERFLGRLTSGERACYYEEQKLLAERFGLAGSASPRRWSSLATTSRPCSAATRSPQRLS